jgi:hypothetical protein
MLIKLTFLCEQIIQAASSNSNKDVWDRQLHQFFLLHVANSVEEDSNIVTAKTTKLVQIMYDLSALLHEWLKQINQSDIVVEDICNRLQVDMFVQTLTTCSEKARLFCGYYYFISFHSR